MTGEYRYQTGIFFDIFDRSLAQQSAYSLVNAQLRYTAEDGKWYLGLWGKNLTNTTYKASALFNGLGGALDFYAPPRTYGLQLGFKM
mgnify:FL=1